MTHEKALEELQLKIVTVKIGSDPSILGCTATPEDLQRWADHVCREVESRFRADVLLVRGSTATMADCDDPEVRDWLRDISQSDEWWDYL